MSFFIRKKPLDEHRKEKSKRKLAVKQKIASAAGDDATKSKKSKKVVDEDIFTASEDEAYNETMRNRGKRQSEPMPDLEETAEEKKIRLAKQYLSEIEQQEKERLETDEIDQSVIASRLRDDVLESQGRLRKKVADNYIAADMDNVKLFKNGHKLSITCHALHPIGKWLFTGSKDCNIIKWDISTCKKMKMIMGGKKGTEEKHKGHTASIMSIAISSDGKFMAISDESKLIHIWNPDTLALIHTFKGHRGAVTGLAFRKQSHTLFSCSADRSVKVWNLEQKVYVETLFGHNEKITAIDSLLRERALTAGGRDSTVRVWKILEESQLLFQGNGESLDCIKFLDEEHFVTGSDEGAVALWALGKKKPVNVVKQAHGNSESETANWITSLACLVNTDLFASGSQDGQVCFWKVDNDYTKVKPLFTIPVTGFVNCLEFSSAGDYMVVSIGQEHRLGRWWRNKEAKNQIMIIPLLKNSNQESTMEIS